MMLVFSRRQAVGVAVFLILLALIFVYSYLFGTQELVVTFIDVGQGDAILIHTPHGRTILVDGGSSESFPQVAEVLKEQNIRRFDALISTHPHSDHLGGLVQIIRNYTVDRIYDTGMRIDIPTYNQYLTLIANKNIPYETPRRGENLDLDPALTLRVLNPTEPLGESLNNASIVLHLEYEDFSLLLPGDIKYDIEAELIAEELELEADVLKVPFHGSRNSSSEEFLEAVAPSKAILSVGENIFGHPHSEALERLDKHDIELMRTDRHGTITLKSDGEDFQITAEKNNKAQRGPTPSHIHLTGSFSSPVLDPVFYPEIKGSGQ